MKRNPPNLEELIPILWQRLNPIQRLALLLQIIGYGLLNRFESIEVRLLTLLAFMLNVLVFHESLPDHFLSPFITIGTAFYSAALLLMVATWPQRRKTAHWIK
jgi:hypothetical protein